MTDPNRTAKVGDRVYFTGTGPHDKGTIVNILLDRFPFVVKWDNSKNEDEIVDRFNGSQLRFVKED